MRKSIIVCVSAFFLLCCTLVCVGYLLPADFQVNESIEIKTTPEKLFANVANLKAWQEWHPMSEAKKAKLVHTYSGPDEGVGAKWNWRADGLASTLEITKAELTKGIEMRCTSPKMKASMCSIEWNAIGDGKLKVSWKLTGELGQNPLARYFRTMFQGMLQQQYKAGLLGLKKLTEETK